MNLSTFESDSWQYPNQMPSENNNSAQISRFPQNTLLVTSEDNTCAQIGRFPQNTPLGMAYVPYQLWSNNVYDESMGFEKGTMFPELDLPFCGEGCGNNV